METNIKLTAVEMLGVRVLKNAIGYQEFLLMSEWLESSYIKPADRKLCPYLTKLLVNPSKVKCVEDLRNMWLAAELLVVRFTYIQQMRIRFYVEQRERYWISE